MRPGGIVIVPTPPDQAYASPPPSPAVGRSVGRRPQATRTAEAADRQPHAAADRLAYATGRMPTADDRGCRFRDSVSTRTWKVVWFRVPDGHRTRYEFADERLGHALEHLLAAVVAVESDQTCPDAAAKTAADDRDIPRAVSGPP